MSDAEAKLAAFFREDRPKAPDAKFRLAVLERRARRQFRLYLGVVMAGGALAIGCIVTMVPHLPAWTVAQPVSGAIPFVSVVVTGASLLLAFARTHQTF